MEGRGPGAAAGPGTDRRPHIVVVGGGQSARWLLFGLAEKLAGGTAPLRSAHITLLEARAEFGTGLPWSKRFALPEHLASLALPVSRWSFGEKQQQQFQGTVGLLREFGVAVTLRPDCEATAVRSAGDRFELIMERGDPVLADIVVLATGYGPRTWRSKALPPALAAGGPRVHRCPWPAAALQEAILDGAISTSRPKHVLILGTYLNGIDAALSLALKAGRFQVDADGRCHFEAPENFRLVLGSRSGQLPKVFGREAPAGRPMRCIHQERLKEAHEQSASGAPFLPIDRALESLLDELALAEDVPSRSAATAPFSALAAVARSRRAPVRRRVRAWLRHLSRRDPAETLRADIAAVMASGRPFGTYADLQDCWWQSFIDGAMIAWSENSPWFPAEDQLFFDRELRTSFYNHMLPMTLHNGLQIEAMMRSGHLRVERLGPGYRLERSPDGHAVILTRIGPHGRVHEAFTDVVDATGPTGDIALNPAPLIQDMLRSGFIQPSLRPFRTGPATPAHSDPDRTIVRGDTAYLVGAGIFVNPTTCEVLPRGVVDMRHSSGPAASAIYAMGPNLSGQFVDAQSLGQTQRDARRIAEAIAGLCRSFA